MHVTFGQSAPRKPGFLWQGVLIVLPVVMLALVGLSFLQQDRRLALSEASDRAESVGEDLASRIWEALTNTNNAGELASGWFRVDSNARLVYPPEFSPTPKPQPLDVSVLNSAQAELWAKAEDGEKRLGAPGDTADANAASDAEALQELKGTYTRFLESDPPARFSAIASYRLGLLLIRTGEKSVALDTFRRLSSSRQPGESGLPLGQLAHFQRVLLISEPTGIATDSENDSRDDESAARLRALVNSSRRFMQGLQLRFHVEELCAKLVKDPTPLTPYLLQRIADDPRLQGVSDVLPSWWGTWKHHQQLRASYASISELLKARLSLPGLASFRPPGATNVPAFGIQVFWHERTPAAQSLTTTALASASNQGPEHWLVTAVPAEDGTFLVKCRSEADAVEVAQGMISGRTGVPAYLGAQAQLAGRLLTHGGEGLHVWREMPYMTRSGGGLRKEVTSEIATKLQATAGVPGMDLSVFRVDVYLTSPTNLFRRQNARTFWVGSVILASAAAALVGLVVAHRAFSRQLRLNELKSNFVSSVSHELRAPIASIRLMAESLDRGTVQEPAKQREYFGFIVRECRRLSDLIGNVLDFSRIDQGRKRYEFEETDVRALVDQTVKVMEPTAGERGVRLACIHPGVTDAADNCATMDGHAIQQALVNLIDNAIKHSLQGETVTIGWERSLLSAAASDRELRTSNLNAGGLSQSQRSSTGTTLSLWVEDHGPGIPQEEHERIFERFYRCGSELRRETQGVGIGLSIVKHIVEAHGGTVRVRSSPGKGSRFTIELPCNAS